MGDFFDKLSRAADAFAEIMTEDVSCEKEVSAYRYADMKKFILSKRREYPQIKKCTISMERSMQYGKKVFAENCYIIQMVLMDEQGKPILLDGSADEYVGGVIIAKTIDKELHDFMNHHKNKTIVIGG